ncbi:MAG: DUF2490 domain-containing protein [Flavobacteriales bacterium]
MPAHSLFTMWSKLVITIACLGVLEMNAQINDAGLWTGVSLNSEVKKDFELSFSPEFRLDENLTRLSSYFMDIGSQYKLNKNLSFSAGYRIGGRNSGDFYNLRQRVQVGLTLKKKVKDFTLSWSPRWQGSIQGVGIENDGDFITTLRNRFKAVYGGIKKYEISSSFEFFNSTSAYSPPYLQNWRWILNLERDLKKGQSFSVGYLVQRDLTESPMEMDFVFLLNYSIRMDIYKKKVEKKDEEKKSGGHDHN